MEKYTLIGLIKKSIHKLWLVVLYVCCTRLNFYFFMLKEMFCYFCVTTFVPFFLFFLSEVFDFPLVSAIKCYCL